MAWVKKKALELLDLRAELVGQMRGSLPDHCLLPQGYVLDVATSRSLCECGGKLHKQWLEIRRPRGILLGEPRMMHHIKQCPDCRRAYRCERLGELIPPYGNYAFDLIVAVGRARFLGQKQNREIQQELQDRFGLLVPCTTIGHLANTFLDGLGAVHYEGAARVDTLVNQDGGYALHLDGTCEAGTDTVFAAIDGRSELVLVSGKMPTENKKDIAELIGQCVKLFGQPISVMRDLSDSIDLAVKAELSDSGVASLLCHYHFLENVGTRLCEKLHGNLTKRLRKLRMRAALKSVRRELVKGSRTGARLSEQQIVDILEDPRKVLSLDAVQLRRYLAYLLLRWLDDYGTDLKGEYFPFDLPTLTFYRRCVKLYEMLEGLLGNYKLKPRQFQTIQTIREKLAAVREDEELVAAAARLEKAGKLFAEVRAALHFESPGNKPILRQHPPRSTLEVALQVESRLEVLRCKQERIASDSADADRRNDARVVLNYLDKYGEELFGHAVFVEGRTDPILVARTNNVPEHCFAHVKQWLRRKVGLKKLTRCVQAMRPEVLLVANLKSQDYLDALYRGSLENMPSVFAKHWREAKNTRQQRCSERSTRPMPLSKKKLRDEALLPQIGTAMNMLIGATLGARRVA
jgi:hypothetical protein